jgi:uncharacterized protein HemX
MDFILQLLGDNWQPIAVAIALIIAAVRAAWMEWQRRQMMGSSKRAAHQESEINSKATHQVVEGMQAISDAKDEALQETANEFAAKSEELEAVKAVEVTNLKKDPNELLKRISKLTGAKRVD